MRDAMEDAVHRIPMDRPTQDAPVGRPFRKGSSFSAESTAKRRRSRSSRIARSGALPPSSVTPTARRDVFRGEVVDAVVMENRGFGFVTFRQAASAQRFLETHHHEIDAKQIEAKAAVPKHLGGSAQLTRKMFVGGTVSRCRCITAIAEVLR